jgi:hypothetical protein
VPSREARDRAPGFRSADFRFADRESEEVTSMPLWAWILIIVLVVLVISGGVGYGRR